MHVSGGDKVRNPKKVIYTSSYDRGLQHLLEIWPDVKKEVPEATLDIFYGWKLFDQFYKDNPASMSWKGKMLEMMKAEGVTDNDRVSQAELTKEYESAGIFAYPAHFGEINCISAIKAQAYGAIPVVINYAALRETVQFGIKVDGDVYDREVNQEFKKQLIWALQNEEWQKEVRKPMMEWAGNITWENVAKQWSSVFKGEEPLQVITSPQNPIVKIIDGYSGKDKSNG